VKPGAGQIEHHRTERYWQRPFSSGLGLRMLVMNYADKRHLWMNVINDPNRRSDSGRHL
jgi:hypothetical protein